MTIESIWIQADQRNACYRVMQGKQQKAVIFESQGQWLLRLLLPNGAFDDGTLHPSAEIATEEAKRHLSVRNGELLS